MLGYIRRGFIRHSSRHIVNENSFLWLDFRYLSRQQRKASKLFYIISCQIGVFFFSFYFVGIIRCLTFVDELDTLRCDTIRNVMRYSRTGAHGKISDPLISLSNEWKALHENTYRESQRLIKYTAFWLDKRTECVIVCVLPVQFTIDHFYRISDWTIIDCVLCTCAASKF